MPHHFTPRGDDEHSMNQQQQPEAAPFPVDDVTLGLLWTAVRPKPGHTRSSLLDLLDMLRGERQETWHVSDAVAALVAEIHRLRRWGVCVHCGDDTRSGDDPSPLLCQMCAAAGRGVEDAQQVGGLVMTLIEFDPDGGSVGRSWEVQDPTTAAHLRHVAGHLGEPMATASSTELEQMYERREDGEGGDVQGEG